MRFLTMLVVVVAALYSGYWFVGANTVENGAETAVSNLQAEGWTVDIGDLKTRGFPSRFDTTASDVDLTSPDQNFSYRAPFVQAFALSYAPNKVIAAFANEQQIQFGNQTLDVTSDALRASASVEASAETELQDLTVEVGAFSISSNQGWDLGLSRALVALRQTPNVGNTYDAYMETASFALSSSVTPIIAQQTDLPPTIDIVKIDGRVLFDKPLDRALASSNVQPIVQMIELRSASFTWGSATLNATGAFNVLSTGFADGNLTIELSQWEDLITVLAQLGAIEVGIAPTLQNMATMMANGSEVLTVPLSFEGGVTRLNGFPVGPAPKFY